jgi:hypothetical protein
MSPSTGFSLSATQQCAHFSTSVPWRDVKDNVYATEVRIFDHLVNRVLVTAADTASAQLFFVGCLI